MNASMSPRFHAAACCSSTAVMAAAGSAARSATPANENKTQARRSFFMGLFFGEQVEHRRTHRGDAGFHGGFEGREKLARVQRRQRRAGALAFDHPGRVRGPEAEKADRHLLHRAPEQAEIL